MTLKCGIYSQDVSFNFESELYKADTIFLRRIVFKNIVAHCEIVFLFKLFAHTINKFVVQNVVIQLSLDIIRQRFYNLKSTP